MKMNVVFIRVGQIQAAVKLCVIAQAHMDAGKRFGCCVWGQSGIGKTAVTDGIADHFSAKTGRPWSMIDCNLSACTPEDVAGYPSLVDGAMKFVSQWNLEPNSCGVFRLDEFDRPAYFQNLIALAKFAIDRQVEKPLPANWFVLALGNGVSDSHTQELTEHLKGRFIHLYVSTNGAKAQAERLAYLEQSGASKTLIKFTRMSPLQTRDDEFEAHAIDNDRTRKYADAILMAYDTLTKQGIDLSEIILPVLAGTIGKTQAIELLKVHELGDLPTLDEVIANPKTTTIPDDLSLRHKYITVLVAEAQTDCDKAVKLMDYLVRLPNEVARYAIEALSLACPAVCKAAVYVNWLNRLNA